MLYGETEIIEMQPSHERWEPETVEEVEEKAFWEKKVDEFKEKAREFSDALTAFIELGKDPILSANATLQAEYNALLERGFSIKDKVAGITNKIDAALKWVKDTFGEISIDEAQQLGAFPLLALVPIAAIAGALALITKWLSDIYLFNRRMTETKNLLEKGVAPQQVESLIAASSPAPLLGNMQVLVKWGMIGFAAYLVYQGFLKGRK